MKRMTGRFLVMRQDGRGNLRIVVPHRGYTFSRYNIRRMLDAIKDHHPKWRIRVFEEVIDP